MVKKAVIAALFASGVGGCATLVHGQYDVVQVSTFSSAGRVDGAVCTITAGPHQFRVVSPSSATLPRGHQLTVICQHPVHGEGSTLVRGSPSGANLLSGILFAPIPVAALVASGMESYSGASQDYPDQVTVTLISAARATRVAVVPLSPAGDPIEALCVFDAGGSRWLVQAPGDALLDPPPERLVLRCSSQEHGEAEVALARREDGSYPGEVRFRFPAMDPGAGEGAHP